MLNYKNKYRIALQPSYNMEKLILKTIDHVKHFSNGKVSFDSILRKGLTEIRTRSNDN